MFCRNLSLMDGICWLMNWVMSHGFNWIWRCMEHPHKAFQIVNKFFIANLWAQQGGISWSVQNMQGSNVLHPTQTSWYLFYELIICMLEYWLKETLMTILECQNYFIVEWHSLNAMYPISWNFTKQLKPMDISWENANIEEK